MGEVGPWTIPIVASVAFAAVVAAWRPRFAVALAPVAGLAFVVSLGFSLQQWEDCNPCPRIEHVFEWINSILAVLAPSLLIAGFVALVVRRLQRH